MSIPYFEEKLMQKAYLAFHQRPVYTPDDTITRPMIEWYIK